jgi:hypothetical protein
MTARERDETRALIVQAVHDAMPEAVEKAMPEMLGEALGPIVNRTVAKAIRRTRIGAIVGYLILAGGLGYVIKDNRDRAQAGRAVLCKIITDGDSTTYAYHREGLLNDRQLDRALRQAARYREQLGPAPYCSPTISRPPMP